MELWPCWRNNHGQSARFFYLSDSQLVFEVSAVGNCQDTRWSLHGVNRQLKFNAISNRAREHIWVGWLTDCASIPWESGMPPTGKCYWRSKTVWSRNPPCHAFRYGSWYPPTRWPVTLCSNQQNCWFFSAKMRTFSPEVSRPWRVSWRKLTTNPWCLAHSWHGLMFWDLGSRCSH